MASSGELGEMWELFMCHASEDKDEIARPLAQRLKSCGLKVWYDDDALVLGDSLRRSIDEGLAKSKYGIVILSPSFFRKNWPQVELDGLIAREKNGIGVILPVWHNIDFDGVLERSPILAGRYAAKSSEGIEMVTEKILIAIKKKNESTAIDGSKYYRDLSEDEVDILISALNNHGIIYIIETEQTGPFLQISDKDYLNEGKPEVRVSYIEALNKLIEQKLVYQETERCLSLTKTGFEYARGLEIDVLMEKAWDHYENKKDFRKSIENYREIVEKYPKSGAAKEAQKMIGINYLHTEDPINAEIEFKKAIALGNEFSSAYFYFGEALLLNKKYKEAQAAFENSLSKSDAPDWIKSAVPGKIKLCQNGVTATLAALADEKYEIEKDRINKEIPLQEANLKEKAGLKGMRWSSGLARKLFELNLDAAKRKIETRLRLDKEIIFSGKKIRSKRDVAFLFERLKATVETERKYLEEKIKAICEDCHARSYLVTAKDDIDQEIKTLLKEKHTDLIIETETLE